MMIPRERTHILMLLSLSMLMTQIVFRPNVQDILRGPLSVSRFYGNQHHRENNANKKTLNIHLVCHTHDDPGWLKTIDQYFEGKNNSIVWGCVSCILDSVIKALKDDPKRKFTYVEMSFFSMWWDKQSSETKSQVRKLVERNQLSFANGGWCMHDEATTHYQGMIDQTTLGHDFLNRELDYRPRVTWQIDPFGHSSTQASLLGSEAGFDAIYFGRIDYQDLMQRQETRNCEGIWDSSPNLNDTEIFWGLTGSYDGNYNQPTGFCFDAECQDEKLVGLNQTELFDRAYKFMINIQTQSNRTRGNNIMVTMGADFQYSSASTNFENMDLLISTINENQDSFISELFPDYDVINAFYSTPDMYTDYKYEELKTDPNDEMKFEVKTDDFFPYSDCEHCFWAGFYTSRPALKRLERVGSSFLHVTRQVQSFFTTGLEGSDSILELEMAVGLIQHHDAVTGTSKQHVANDYAKQLQSGIDNAASFVSKVIKRMFNNVEGNEFTDVTFCQLLNESICELPQEVTKPDNSSTFYAILYNALPQSRSDIVAIPVSQKGPYIVEKGNQEGKFASNVKWTEVSSIVASNQNEQGVNKQSAPYSLYFDSDRVAPISMTLYRIRQELKNQLSFKNNQFHIQRFLSGQKNASNSKEFVMSNGILHIAFDGGIMKRIWNIEGTSLKLDKRWGYYESFPRRDNDSPASGAYIFRPKSPDEDMVAFEVDTSKTYLRKSSILTELHLHYEVPWLKEVVKLYRGKAFVDIDYTVGPIDISDGVGKEIIIQMNNDIENKGIFYTDSNAREFIRRKRSQRSSYQFQEFEPIAGNYYPVTAAIFIEDEEASMTILTDRSQGGSSLKDGSIELMVHRRTLYDDSRGVGEALNETSKIMPYPPFGDASRKGEGLIISGTYRIMIGSGNSGAELARSEMDNMFSPLYLFAAKTTLKRRVPPEHRYLNTLSGFDEAFPKNLHLVTMKRVFVGTADATYLVRLGHRYGIGESSEYSAPIEFDLSKLFERGGKMKTITSVIETTLTANMEKIEREHKKKQWIPDSGQKDHTANMIKITIYPMQIKTWLITVT